MAHARPLAGYYCKLMYMAWGGVDVVDVMLDRTGICCKGGTCIPPSTLQLRRTEQNVRWLRRKAKGPSNNSLRGALYISRIIYFLGEPSDANAPIAEQRQVACIRTPVNGCV